VVPVIPSLDTVNVRMDLLVKAVLETSVTTSVMETDTVPILKLDVFVTMDSRERTVKSLTVLITVTSMKDGVSVLDKSVSVTPLVLDMTVLNSVVLPPFPKTLISRANPSLIVVKCLSLVLIRTLIFLLVLVTVSVLTVLVLVSKDLKETLVTSRLVLSSVVIRVSVKMESVLVMKDGVVLTVVLVLLLLIITVRTTARTVVSAVMQPASVNMENTLEMTVPWSVSLALMDVPSMAVVTL